MFYLNPSSWNCCTATTSMTDAMDIDTDSKTTESSSENFNALSDRFMSWLQSRPDTFINPNIALVDLRAEGAGRGVVSTAPLTPDTPLFTIPHSSTLSVLTSTLTTFLIPESMKGLNEENPWMALVLALIYETRPESDWKPYMDLLPREFDTLMYWTPAELKALEGSAVVAKIGKDEAEDSFKKVLGPVVNKHRELFQGTELRFHDASGEVDEESLIQAAHRMASCIMAYSFDIMKHVEHTTTDDSDDDSDSEEEQHYKAMVPLADMLNADADKNNARLFQHPSSLTMSPLTLLPAHTPLYNDYGPLPRSDLLRRYGYITPNYAQYDVVELRGDLITETITTMRNPTLSEQAKLARIEYLIDEEVLEDAFDLGVPETGAKNIPSEFVGIYYILTQPQTETPQFPSSNSLVKKIAKTRGYKECILTILNKRLGMYPPLADNSHTIDPSASSTKRRLDMAKQVRDGEISILTALIKEVEEWIVEEEEQNQSSNPADKKRKVGSSSNSSSNNRKKIKK